MPAGESGELFFEGGPEFEYFKDPAKTASVSNDRGWRSLGDMGYVDDDGYLYLTDRSTFMIVSGGVNIYPQEAENVLVMHPKLVDAAVFGVPNDEFGEEVKAVVQPVDGVDAGPDLEAELIEYCRAHLAALQVPAHSRIRPGAAARPERQALQETHPRTLLAGPHVADRVKGWRHGCRNGLAQGSGTDAELDTASGAMGGAVRGPDPQAAVLRPGVLRAGGRDCSGRASGRWRAGSRRSPSPATSSNTRSSTSPSSWCGSTPPRFAPTTTPVATAA